jgi:hypothetical protein
MQRDVLEKYQDSEYLQQHEQAHEQAWSFCVLLYVLVTGATLAEGVFSVGRSPLFASCGSNTQGCITGSKQGSAKTIDNKSG